MAPAGRCGRGRRPRWRSRSASWAALPSLGRGEPGAPARQRLKALRGLLSAGRREPPGQRLAVLGHSARPGLPRALHRAGRLLQPPAAPPRPLAPTPRPAVDSPCGPCRGPGPEPRGAPRMSLRAVTRRVRRGEASYQRPHGSRLSGGPWAPLQRTALVALPRLSPWGIGREPTPKRLK